MILFDVCEPRRSSALGVQAGLTESELPRVGTLPPEPWDEDDGEFVEPVCLFGCSTAWRAGAFHAFIEAVAGNRVSGLFAALETGSVYAPYDGGADLFFSHGLGARPGARALRRLALLSSGRPVGLASSGGNLTCLQQSGRPAAGRRGGRIFLSHAGGGGYASGRVADA
jgi:hypothetical protein